jgi:hypothetical protein
MSGSVDNTKQFIVRKMVEGLRRVKRKNDTRDPVTHDILEKIIQSLPLICRSKFESLLFAAAYSLAFIALLRVSEFTLPGKRSKKPVLQFEDVTISDTCLRLIIKSSKTDQRCNGCSVVIPIDPQNRFCVKHIRSYIYILPSGSWGSTVLLF